VGHRTTNSTLQDLKRDHLRVVQKETMRHRLREGSFFHSLLHSNRVLKSSRRIWHVSIFHFCGLSDIDTA